MSGSSPVLAIGVAAALIGATSVGWRVAPDAPPHTSRPPVGLVALSMPVPNCGSATRVTCVVDGDTFWLRGEKIRILGYDSPEIQGACAHERQLAARATRRLGELLSTSPFTVERQRHDRYGRRLAVVRVSGRDLTEFMVGEGLAQVYRGHKAQWC
jgi:micrococcal nuclease